jgi:hypothetical protein
MKSSIVKRSIVVAGHNTSVSLEDAFWKMLKEIASFDSDDDAGCFVLGLAVCVNDDDDDDDE